LADLITRPERVSELSPAERDALLQQIAAVLVVLSTARTTEPEASANGDRLLTVQEVADLVRQDRAWVWRRSRRADWARFVVKPSRKVLLVRESGLRRWLATRGR
jgi:hypothetical protein